MLRQIRYFIIRIFLTDSEKYLVVKAIEDREETLRKVRLEKWANQDDIRNDLTSIFFLKKIFKTPSTK